MEATQNSSSENTGTTARPPSVLELMRLLAVQNPDAMHRAFDSYPWAKDPTFQSLLANELLGQHEQSPAEIALHCRIKRYEENIGIKVDPERYQAYRSGGGERPKVSLVSQIILEQEALYEPDVSKRRYAALASNASVGQATGLESGQVEDREGQALPWQRAAPKTALYIDRNNTAATGAFDKEPYPKKFEQILEFLQSGKEIPGIVKIPDTVVDDPSISTTTGRAAPLKPWEKQAVSDAKTS
ncbi:hypothetical protein BJ170DRAFT_488279 [Xylariales sp. AK1849]|nr:hypothetical protein BJ170DRAFT_488279 [Xylariales sp. AK1849]